MTKRYVSPVGTQLGKKTRKIAKKRKPYELLTIFESNPEKAISRTANIVHSFAKVNISRDATANVIARVFELSKVPEEKIDALTEIYLQKYYDSVKQKKK